MDLSKRIETGSLLVYGLLLICAGGFMTFFPDVFMSMVSFLLLCFFGISFVLNAIALFSRHPKQEKRRALLSTGSLMGDLAAFILVLIFEDRLFTIISLCFGIWTLFNGLVKLILYVEYRKNQVSGRLLTLFAAVVSLVLGFVFLASPAMHRETSVFICGVYLMVYGITYIQDFIRQVYPSAFVPGKRRLHLGWPAFLVALMPNAMIKKINAMYAKKQVPPLHAEKSSAPPDIEVFVHASEEGFSKFGHVDLYFEGRVYTYGCYDDRTKWFFTLLGEGHLITTEHKQAYLRLAIAYSKKTIFGFGLRLTEEQKQFVRHKLKDFSACLVPWYPDAQLAEQGRLPNEPYNDYASLLYTQTDAQFFRVTKGRFKTYFVLGTNCVLWADQILGAAGLDMIRVSGIITPGSYYDYLTKQYHMENTAVISYTVYREKQTT